MDVDTDVKRSDDERGPSKPRGERDRQNSVRERERDHERDRERRDRSRASTPGRLRISTLTDLPIARRRSDHWDGDDKRTDVRFFSPLFVARLCSDAVFRGCSGARPVDGTDRGLVLVLADAPLRRVGDAGAVEGAVRALAHLRAVEVVGTAADATRPYPGHWEDQ
jgi:hypothetical protein